VKPSLIHVLVAEEVILKLFKHHCRISVRSNFFVERVINAWNGCPADHMEFHYNIVLTASCLIALDVVCVSMSTISAVSACLYLQFVLIVFSCVFTSCYVVMANK